MIYSVRALLQAIESNNPDQRPTFASVSPALVDGACVRLPADAGFAAGDSVILSLNGPSLAITTQAQVSSVKQLALILD